jgi:gluconate:H+ symporter, GntP family
MLTPIYILCLLILSITAIVLLSAKGKFNIFFVLLFVATLVGFAAGFEGEKIIGLLKKGFGATLEKIGLLIILGTTLGILLDRSRATLSLAAFILRKMGEKNAPIAVTLMGFIIGLPIFCDSGFIVLIGLVLSLSARLRGQKVLLVVCLATSLYAVHCLVPPHPGISAAAGLLKVDLGKAMLLGSILSIPTTFVAFIFAYFSRHKFAKLSVETTNNSLINYDNLPSVFMSFLPIITPIFLIAFKSIMLLNPHFFSELINAKLSLLINTIKFLGEPIAALSVGILLSLFLLKSINKTEINALLGSAIDKSGNILVIIAMGGAFGEIIKAMDLGKIFGASLAASGLGLFIPFILTAILKTAQGSSTVAIITASGIIEPLLSALGMDTEGSRLLVLMAMGAGSMTISHANDAYFWVISKFGDIETDTTLKTYSVATVIMGFVAFISVYFASFFIH